MQNQVRLLTPSLQPAACCNTCVRRRWHCPALVWHRHVACSTQHDASGPAAEHCFVWMQTADPQSAPLAQCSMVCSPHHYAHGQGTRRWVLAVFACDSSNLGNTVKLPSTTDAAPHPTTWHHRKRRIPTRTKHLPPRQEATSTS
jgi:hypothetical protein